MSRRPHPSQVRNSTLLSAGPLSRFSTIIVLYLSPRGMIQSLSDGIIWICLCTGPRSVYSTVCHSSCSIHDCTTSWLNQERESANGHSRAGSRVVTKRGSRIGISPTHSYMEAYHEGH